MIKKQNIVVFDFDGTLSAGDANTGFVLYCFMHSPRPWFFLPLILLGGILKLFDRPRVPGRITSLSFLWRRVMRRCLSADMVARLAPEFIRGFKKKRFAWAKKTVAAEKAAGNIALCLSASPSYLIKPLVEDLGFDGVICSEMDRAQPWKYKSFKSFNWGENKVVALDGWARRKKIMPNVVRAYSDNKSDMPMMSLAKEQIWINPKTGQRVSG
ncbi:MAG: haloacid dehalogenase-like hydrolase [Alphaproteobacteria bacterium]|nr:haloacid dehalogenase-like hydrolase [Alphaproteobacteria bacterium]